MINHRGRRSRIAFCCLALITFVCLTAACASNGQSGFRPSAGYNGGDKYLFKNSQVRNAVQLEPSKNQGLIDNLMQTAFSQKGKLYRYGGSSPATGFDCSGFVKWVYGQNGYELPRTSYSMRSVGKPVQKGDLRPGDLVLFAGRVSHVGIYTGNGMYIHSPSTGKRIKESSLDDGYSRKTYIGARRIVGSPDGVKAIDDSLQQAWVRDSRQQFADSRAAGDEIAPKARAKKDNVKTASRETSRKETKSSAVQNDGKSAKKSSGKTDAKAAKSGKKHTVKAGDTLYDLSKKYGVSQDDLIKANKLGNGKKHLQLGQTLVLPKKN